MAAYAEYLKWGAYIVAALGAWRFMPLAIIRLVAAFTHSEERHRQCMEVLRLARRDADRIPSYISGPLTGDNPRQRKNSLSGQRNSGLTASPTPQTRRKPGSAPP